MHYLGLDWGERKIGIALSDDETRIAYAHTIMPNDAAVLDTLAQIVAEYNVSTIVIGVPLHTAHGNTGEGARAFAQKIREALPTVTVQCVDEMFTTRLARAGRVAAGKSGGDDDADAARIILQDWLDTAT